MHTADPLIKIVKAKKSTLYAEDGKKYIDGVSSWWVNTHGHSQQLISKQLRKQLKVHQQLLFANFTHQGAIDLAQNLLKLLPTHFKWVFYSENGSTAVEIAIKMALQYWHNQNPYTKKTKIICFKEGYHGDTFGAMSVSGKTAFNRPFWSHLFDVHTIKVPYCGHEAESLQQLNDLTKTDEIAAFIYEPLILGSAGMRCYSKSGLNALLKCCHQHHIITIADEVMTGFGRTEKLFASDSLEEKPSIICLAKGLTGGCLPLAVTICSDFIYQAFLSYDVTKAFLHGHSYTANSLACQAALANIELLTDGKCDEQRKYIALNHYKFSQQHVSHPKLTRCECLGTILAVEYKVENPSYFSALRHQLYHFFLARGIFLRPLGNVIYLMPPYCISKKELTYIYQSITESLEVQWNKF